MVTPCSMFMLSMLSCPIYAEPFQSLGLLEVVGGGAGVQICSVWVSNTRRRRRHRGAPWCACSRHRPSPAPERSRCRTAIAMVLRCWPCWSLTTYLCPLPPLPSCAENCCRHATEIVAGARVPPIHHLRLRARAAAAYHPILGGERRREFRCAQSARGEHPDHPERE